MTIEVPFNWPHVPERSRQLVNESLASGHLSGDGPMTRLAVDQLKELCGEREYLLTPSCTHALELAFHLLDLGPGDEVIMPSFNFPSAATAAAMCGAVPVFVDVDPVSKCITASGIRAAITAQTRAVVVLHYAGVAANMSEICQVADEYGLPIIEEAAHGLGISGSEGRIGSFGTFAAYSFHETKNFQCGEGGALQINDTRYVARAEILREKGTNRQRFFRGLVDKYTWVDHGSSWLLADPLAALLSGQLEDFSAIQGKRVAIWDRYQGALQTWADSNNFELPYLPERHENAGHMFYLVAPSLAHRTIFMSHMRSRGVATAFHYQPLHSAEGGRRLGRGGPAPQSEQLADRLVRLPLFHALSESQCHHVIESAIAFQS